MSKVAIITDSVAGLPPEWVKQWDITVIPAAIINANGKRYVEGVDISTQEAYDLAMSTQKYTTSSINPGIVYEAFKSVAQKSDRILLVSLASALGAVYSMANSAAGLIKEEMPNLTIRVHDSKTTSAGQGLLAMAAGKAAAAGRGIDEIVGILEALRPRTGCLNLLDTLKYVYRTGRVSRFKSELAALMHVKPLMKMMPSGELENVARARDHAKGVSLLMDWIRKELPPERCHFLILHAVAPDWAKEAGELIKREFKPLSVTFGEYSAVMGYAVGKGCLSVGFMPEPIK